VSRGGQQLTRGSVIMTATKVIAVITGYATNVFLARSLGPEQFGLFGAVITVLIWLELIVAEGLPLHLARTLDPDTHASDLVKRGHLIAQVGVALGLSALLVALAPLLARAFSAPSSAVLFRVAAIDIPFFALYNLFLGVLLGAQMYGGQGASTTSYNVAKLVGTVALVGSFGLAVTGAVLGSITASLVGAVVAGGMVLARMRTTPAAGTSPRHDAETLADSVAGSVAPAAFMLLQAMLFSVGLWILRAEIPGDAAGHFRAASLVAIVPIELSAGITWALFSAYATAFRRGDSVKCKHYVSQTVRLLLVAIGLWTAAVATTAEPLMTLLFSAEYAAGATDLAILGIGLGFGSLATTLAPLHLVRGKARQLIWLTAGLLVVELVATLILAPAMGDVGVALATGGTLIVAGVGTVLVNRGDIAFSLTSLVMRLALATTVTAGLALLVPPPSPAWLFALYPAMTLVYLAMLWLLRVVTPSDFEAFREGLR
jgi:stage V sporulation protein B